MNDGNGRYFEPAVERRLMVGCELGLAERPVTARRAHAQHWQ